MEPPVLISHIQSLSQQLGSLIDSIENKKQQQPVVVEQQSSVPLDQISQLLKLLNQPSLKNILTHLCIYIILRSIIIK